MLKARPSSRFQKASKRFNSIGIKGFSSSSIGGIKGE